MGHGDIHGKASVDPNNPSAFGVSDFSGFWHNRRRMVRQLEWNGTAKVWTGMLVAPEEADVPQPQLRAIRLPPDPVPVDDPRTEIFQELDYLLGFTQYVMWPNGSPLPYVVVLTDEDGDPILTGSGQEIIIEIGSDGPALLAQLSEMTDIPIPGTIESYNTTIAVAGVSQTLLAAAVRSYIAIFNPCGNPIWVNVGAAASATPGQGSIAVGSGGCLFWATAAGSVPTALEITVLGQTQGVPVYAYAAP